jgi:hypothetical protein
LIKGPDSTPRGLMHPCVRTVNDREDGCTEDFRPV